MTAPPALPLPPASFLLESFDRRSREEILKSTPRRLPPGSFLFMAGEPARNLYVIERGVVKLTGRHGNGREAILSLSLPGDLPGLAAAICGAPHRFDAVALSAARIRPLDPIRMRDLLASRSASAQRALLLLAREAYTVTASALEMTGADATGRMASRLLELADTLGIPRRGSIELRLPINQEDLGRMAATSRETACKTLRSLRAQGVLEYDGPTLRINRPDVLERLRCGARAARPSRSASAEATRRSRSR